MISYVKIFTENKEGMSSFWGSYNDLKKKYHVRHSQLFINHKQQGWWLIEQQDDLCLCHLNFCIDHIPDHLPRNQMNIAQQCDTKTKGLQTNRTEDKSYGLWTNRTETNCTD